MSQAALIECNSSDPFVRELGRRAIRVLNDTSLDRAQREALIRRLQARLQGHLQAVDKRAARQAAKARKAPPVLPGTVHSQAFASPQSLLARQRELPGRHWITSDVPTVRSVETTTDTRAATVVVEAANVSRYHRTTLHLRKAA